MQQPSAATGRLRKLLQSDKGIRQSKKDLELISSNSHESESSVSSSKTSKRKVIFE